jgi:hypothetical protein
MEEVNKNWFAPRKLDTKSASKKINREVSINNNNNNNS